MLSIQTPVEIKIWKFLKMTLTLVNLHVLGGNIAPSNSFSSKLQSRWSNVIFPDTNGV
jgi:hypothetical protein